MIQTTNGQGNHSQNGTITGGFALAFSNLNAALNPFSNERRASKVLNAVAALDASAIESQEVGRLIEGFLVNHPRDNLLGALQNVHDLLSKLHKNMETLTNTTASIESQLISAGKNIGLHDKDWLKKKSSELTPDEKKAVASLWTRSAAEVFEEKLEMAAFCRYHARHLTDKTAQLLETIHPMGADGTRGLISPEHEEKLSPLLSGYKLVLDKASKALKNAEESVPTIENGRPLSDLFAATHYLLQAVNPKAGAKDRPDSSNSLAGIDLRKRVNSIPSAPKLGSEEAEEEVVRRGGLA